MKKKLIIIYIIFFLIGLHLSFRYLLNEKFISDYKNGKYTGNVLDILKIINYPDSYIVYFNKGDSYYRKQEYKNAQDEFEKALKRAPEDKVCIVTNNLSLSMLQQVDFEKKGWDEKLIAVEDVLIKDECATIDNNGNDEDSQELYNEIEYILQNAGQGNGEGDEQDDEQQQEEEENDEDDKEEDIREKIKKQQEEVNKERDKDLGDNDYKKTEGNTFGNGGNDVTKSGSVNNNQVDVPSDFNPYR